MSETKIEYLNLTWNPITGCIPGQQCWDRCWARKMTHRMAANPTVENRERYDGFSPAFWPERLTEPLKWKKPRRIGVSFMGDIGLAPADQLDKIFAVMATCRQHQFFVLTKRPDRLACYLTDAEPLPNVLIGTSVGDQGDADHRIPALLRCPGRHWLSIEPMLGPLNIEFYPRTCPSCGKSTESSVAGVRNSREAPFAWYCRRGRCGNQYPLPSIDFVALGGETGPDARPCHPVSVQGVRDQCVAAGVPFFFKGWGEWAPQIENSGPLVVSGDGSIARVLGVDGDCGHTGNGPYAMMGRVGKKAAGRLLDGREWNEMPEVLG